MDSFIVYWCCHRLPILIFDVQSHLSEIKIRVFEMFSFQPFLVNQGLVPVQSEIRVTGCLHGKFIDLRGFQNCVEIDRGVKHHLLDFQDLPIMFFSAVIDRFANCIIR